MDPSPPPQVGPYRLLHLIGSGGMGQVYAAVHEHTGLRVALKLLSTDASRDPQLTARFLQEARALAQLDHPGVVRVLHCDQVDGTAFFTMEHLHGCSLRDWLSRPPDHARLRAALAICAQIAGVMADVHARGIVHRDLKPENVFLCPNESVPPGYRVKLLDFGVAKLPPVDPGPFGKTQVHTQASTFIGTAAYMAPEQLRSASTVDGRADVYGLGVLLFELLAGRTPFVSAELVEMVSMHVRAEPPPLRELAPVVPAALSAFVASMLAKDPAQRPTMRRCREMFDRAWESEREECPLPGLAHFTEAQAELFFGRRVETGAVLALLEEARTGQRRWVQIEGPSGIGKSSLVYAGLLPRLKEISSESGPRWLVATMRPSDEPLRNLARALAAVGAGTGPGRAPEALERDLRAGPATTLRDLAIACTPPGHRLLLVVEQTEELFTLGAVQSGRFDELLSVALEGLECPLRLLTSVRSDFLHRFEQLPLLARLLNSAARHHLQPMEERALAEVIHGMARHCGLRLSEGLAERMVQDARGEGGRLPLLGHAVRSLWSLSGDGSLTHEQYDRLGGVGGALARQVEHLLDGLGDAGRERAKWLLLELVHVGRGVPDTRRPRTRDEVIAAAGGDGLAEEVLLRLSGSRTGPGPDAHEGLRLIALSGGPGPSQQRAELAHETLIHKVPSIAGWIERERAVLERHEDLEAAASAWEKTGCQADDLPTGTLLSYFQAGLRAQASRSTRAARFLRAAVKLQRRRAWIRGGGIASSLAAATAILFFAISAEEERTHAREYLMRVIAAADDFVGDTDWVLSRHPGTLRRRRKELKEFGKMLASLSARDREEPAVRLVSIRLLHRRGDLAYHDDTLAQADELFLKARTEIEAARASSPLDAKLLNELALSYSKRGKVSLARHRLEEARAHFTESIRVLETPGVEWDDIEDHRRTLAVSYTELAELELECSRLDAASRSYDRAIEHFEKNAGEYNRAILAAALGTRGEIALQTDKGNAAQGDIDRAVELARDADRAEQNLFTQSVLARALIHSARLKASRGHREGAFRDLREAETLARQLREGEVENKGYAIILAQALHGLEELASAEEARRRLHEERCQEVRGFVGRDPEDQRLRKLICRDLPLRE